MIKRSALIGLIVASVGLGLAPTASAMTKANAKARTVARAQDNCHAAWEKPCAILQIDVAGPYANAFLKMQWAVHVFVEAPDGSLWEQYCAWDAYGNKLRGSFTKVPISQDFARVASAAWAPVRRCRTIERGITARVAATPNVSCGAARRMMGDLLLGSKKCYPNGYTAHPRCTFGYPPNRFACHTHQYDQGAATFGWCDVNRGRYAEGSAGP